MYISTVDDGLPAGDQVVAEQLRDDLETALFKYQVDLAVRSLGCLPSINKPVCQIWGHCHLYERTCPVYQHICRGNNTMPGAPVHAVIGMAGMGASLDVRVCVL